MRRHTFKQCVDYAIAHNIKFVIRSFSVKSCDYHITICDGFDGYTSSESYCIEYNHNTNGYDGFCYHYRYEFKKDIALFERILSAFNNDYCNIDFDVWCGYGEYNE